MRELEIRAQRVEVDPLARPNELTGPERRVPILVMRNVLVEGADAQRGLVFGNDAMVAQFSEYAVRDVPAEDRARFVRSIRYGHGRGARRRVLFSMKKAAAIGHTLNYEFEYGHFFTEVLPQWIRLYNSVPKDVALLYFVRSTERKQNIIVTEGIMRAFFEFGMWDPSRFVVVDDQDRGSVYVEELYVAPCFKSAIGMRELGEFFMANYARRMARGGSLAPQKPLDGLQVVFQIRKKRELKQKERRRKKQANKPNGRLWENADLCQDSVERLGKSRSLPVGITRDEGNLPISRAIALYESVHVTVGPHGAGISNAVFMRPGSVVIEFCHPGTKEYWRPDCRWFGDELRAMGHRVISLLCKDCLHDGPTSVDHMEVAELVLHLAATLNQDLFTARKQPRNAFPALLILA